MVANTRNVKKSEKTEDKTNQTRIPANKEQKDEYQVIGWIEPVMNANKEENNKVLRVKIYTGEIDEQGFNLSLSGIVLISSFEKFMNKELKAVPIKTKTQEEK